MKVRFLAPCYGKKNELHLIPVEAEVREVTAPALPIALRLDNLLKPGERNPRNSRSNQALFHIHEGELYRGIISSPLKRRKTFMLCDELDREFPRWIRRDEINSILMPRDFRTRGNLYSRPSVRISSDDVSTDSEREAVRAVHRDAGEIVMYRGELYRRTAGPVVSALPVDDVAFRVAGQPDTLSGPRQLLSWAWPDFFAAQDELLEAFPGAIRQPVGLQASLHGDASLLDGVSMAGRNVDALARCILFGAAHKRFAGSDPELMRKVLALSEDYARFSGVDTGGLMPYEPLYPRSASDLPSTASLEQHFDPIAECLGSSSADRELALMLRFAKVILAAERRRLPNAAFRDDPGSELDGLLFN